ncbi:hypothetical protein SISNIDRAFT_553183 [Sistotremastrum niveocremeum HHB9708]|uniref:ABM domain-containing protein n=2 Tax=Sistotremastraceae TaxID=3402574 RepID=A0A164N7B2_9AGAM|nr:hypothetical protein SISNIDRAFT_553183 [Sistotremastrum niveocremeum HHB9708]KZT38563.1 hypothetical protein SISSUDRAFT_1128742 [Sistotremastrum suecicum HHB10207 ss-3]
MSTDPTAIKSGRIILVAQVEALQEKVTAVASHLKAIQARALSPEEPGCYTYRVVQYETKFLVFEEYENVEAFKHHENGAPFQTFAADLSNLIVGPGANIDIGFYSEI